MEMNDKTITSEGDVGIERTEDLNSTANFTRFKTLSKKSALQIGLLLVVAALLVANLLKGNSANESLAVTTTVESQEKSVELVNTAVSQIASQQYEAALLTLREAISTDPEYGLAYYNQGVALQFLNKNAEAIKSYTSALSLNNQDANSYYNRGLALRDTGKLAEAESDLRIASTLKPEWAAAKFNLGQVLISNGKQVEGDSFVQQARELNPNIGK